MRISAGEYCMTQRVGSAVHTRRLPVPQPDHAVMGGIGPGGGQLAAHDGGRRLILVDRRGVHDRQVGCAASGLDGGVISTKG